MERGVITHILFDFFGTLVDYMPSRTAQGYSRSFKLLRHAGMALDYEGFLALWSEVFAQFDAEAESSLREFSMADVATEFLKRAVPDATSGPLAARLSSTYLAEWNSGVRYPDGIAALLQRLDKQYTLAVITNTHDAGLVPTHLGRMGVRGLLAQVFTSVEFGRRKPAPAIFQHALGVLGAKPECCLYVGDNYDADYLGARSAGICALLIDPTHKTPLDGRDRIDSVFQLEERLGAREG